MEMQKTSDGSLTLLGLEKRLGERVRKYVGPNVNNIPPLVAGQKRLVALTEISECEITAMRVAGKEKRLDLVRIQHNDKLSHRTGGTTLGNAIFRFSRLLCKAGYRLPQMPFDKFGRLFGCPSLRQLEKIGRAVVLCSSYPRLSS